ncbi:MAG TPA: type I-C CRISPR-associated protein Cas8c/Csd1 [Chloroflexia bacterium]|nr:type I-C CRISPR-associated protein Cas8c/Csd1 [Chloroflexia bacterium]
MLLQELVEYSYRLPSRPVLYNETPVRYIIELDREGKLLNAEPTATSDPANARTKRGQRYLMPQITRSVGVKPLLLADNAEYTLGLARPESKSERVTACHQAYMDILQRCAAYTDDPLVKAAYAFLSGDPVAQLSLGEDFDRSALVTLRVDGTFLTELKSVQDFWAEENDPAAKMKAVGGHANIMQCLICGRVRPVLDRLQGKIKGIPGGQMAGTSIISANAPAFESYGLEASLIAPTCASCGEGFTKAANALIAGEASHITLGNAVFIFWTREEVGFNFRSFMSDPKPEQVQALIASVRSGKQPPEVEAMEYYAAALSASGGRTVIRDYIDTTVGSVQRQLISWFSRQAIVGEDGRSPQPLGLFALAVSTVRESKDLAPTVPRAMLRAAMAGTPLPMGLVYEAVRRNRAEQKVTRQRAALIKLVLISRGLLEEDTMVGLNSGNKTPAYLCGRLLAVLERAQDLAIPGIKAGIVDRFYGTASSAPASVFGRLMRGVQDHLSKLERDNRGAYMALQKRLEEIQAGLEGFPRTLTLEDQGLFALGYYHQRADDRAQAIAGSERRKTAQAEQTSFAETGDDDDNASTTS